MVDVPMAKLQSNISDLITNYYITISMQKASSIRLMVLEIQHILRSQDLSDDAFF